MQHINVTHLSEMTHLEQAWQSVRLRGNTPGVDGQTPAMFQAGARDALIALQTELRDGSWQPRAGKRIELANDPERPIIVPTVRDRIVQRAIVDALGPLYNRRFLDSSFAYRAGFSVQKAIAEVEKQLADGRKWFLRTDIVKFFDRIERDRLRLTLETDGVERDVQRIISRIIHVGALEGAWWTSADEGVPQGSALSPLLSNIYLHAVDVALTELGTCAWFRYADDILILAATEEERDAAHARLLDELKVLGLETSPRKTKLGHAAENFSFLGVRFSASGKRLTEGSWKALDTALRAQGDVPEQLMPVLNEWEHWYGSLDVRDATTTPILATVILRAALQRGDLPWEECAVRRDSFGYDEAFSPVLHLAMVNAWASLGSRTAARPLIEDMRLVGADTNHPEFMGPLTQCVGVSPSIVAALRKPSLLVAQAAANEGANVLARALRHLLAEPSREEPENPQTATIPDLPAALKRFDVRPGLCLEEVEDGRGHFRFVPLQQTLDNERLARHLNGGKRAGVYLVSPQSTLRACAFRVHVDRKDGLPPWSQGTDGKDGVQGGVSLQARWRTLVAIVHETAVQLFEVAAKNGVQAAIEDDGQDSRVVWICFQSPIALIQARMMMRRILEDITPPPDAIRIGLSPITDRIAHPPGPWLAIPFGVHPRTGRRSQWISPAGEVLGDDLKALLRWPLNDPAHVQRWIRSPRLPRSLEHVTATANAPLPPLQAATDDSQLPALTAVTQGCGVIRMLVDKARRLGHLESVEKRTILEVLGYLPETERLEALRRIYGPMVSSDAELKRRLRDLSGLPLGCRGVRERHGELARRLGCEHCNHWRLEGGAYPSPILHALAPQQIPGIARKMADVAERALEGARRAALQRGEDPNRIGTPSRQGALVPPVAARQGAGAESEGTRAAVGDGSGSGEASTQVQASAGVALERMSNPVFSPLQLDRLQREVLKQFEQLPAVPGGVLAPLQAPMAAQEAAEGVLSGVTPQGARGLGAPMSEAPGGVEPQTGRLGAPGEPKLAAEYWLNRLRAERKQMTEVRRRIQEAEQGLEELFRAAGSDRLELDDGVLVRIPGDPPRYVYEF